MPFLTAENADYAEGSGSVAFVSRHRSMRMPEPRVGAQMFHVKQWIEGRSNVSRETFARNQE